MPWSTLTPQQQAFLEKYLVSSKLDVFRDKHKTKENQEITAEFEGLETLLAEIRGHLAQLPQDYPEHGLLSAQLAEVDRQRQGGDFKAALAAGKALVAEVESTVTTLLRVASELRAKVSAPMQLEGASVEQFNQADGLRQQIAATLGAGVGIPAKAALDNARSLEARFTGLVEQLLKAIAEHQAALAAFNKVWIPAKPKIEQIAAMSLADVSDAPSYDKAAALVAEAQALLQQGNDALVSGSVQTLDTATEAVTAFMAKAKDTDKLLATLVSEVRTILEERYDLLSDWLQEHADFDISGFLDADKATAGALQGDVQMDIQMVRSALAGSDIAAQLAALAQLPAIEARGDLLSAAIMEGNKNLIDDDLQAKGIGDGHRAAMKDLFEEDYESFIKVGDILAETTGVLGNVEVTKDFLDQKKAEVATTAQVADGAFAAYKPAQEEMDKQQAELATLIESQAKIADQIKKAGKTVPKGLQDQLAEVERNIGLKRMVISGLEGPLAALKSTYDTAKQAADDTRAVYEAAQKQKLVLDAVSYGALSPDHGRPVSPEARANILDVIESNAKLGEQALGLLATAADPESFAKTAKYTSDKAADGFEADDGTAFLDQDYADQYAGKLMKMAASLPPEQGVRLEEYIKAGNQFETVPEMTGTSWGEVTKKKSKYVADAALTGGAIDMDKATAAVDHMLFHPDSLSNPTPELGNHMLGTLEFLKGNEAARGKIEGMQKPTTAGGQALVEKSTGNAAGAQGNDDAGRALLSAMMTPVYQGKVGSCFATSSIVRMRADNPEKALDSFIHMINTGNYKPESGREVPVIQNVPADEDPLVRSLEYSSATATARLGNSNERTRLNQSTAKGVDTLEDKFKPARWALLQAKIDAAVSQSFTFLYDPEQQIDLSSDGSSDKGRYVLMNKALADAATTKEQLEAAKVNDKGAFVAAVLPKVMAEITDEDLASGVTKADIEAMLGNDAFVDAMKTTKREKGKDVEKYPWELSSGGATDLAAKTILGETGSTVGYMTELDDSDPLDEPARTKEVIEGFLQQFGGNSGMCTMRTVGQHGFNGVPEHPSLDKLKDGGPGNYGENLQRELYDKATELKNTVIDKDRAGFMFDSAVQGYLSNAKGEGLTKLQEGIAAHRPTADMNPAEFEKAVKDATQAYRDHITEQRVEAYKKSFTDKGEPEPSAEKIEEKRKSVDEALEKQADDASTNRLMKDLGAPEFTIADTNWGSGTDRTFFVIVPDPASGQPKLMKRTDPPGTLSYVGDDWLRKQWAKVI